MAKCSKADLYYLPNLGRQNSLLWLCLQVMEEVMAKSKAFRAEKQKQREEDLDATEALDKSLAALMQSGAIQGALFCHSHSLLPDVPYVPLCHLVLGQSLLGILSADHN